MQDTNTTSTEFTPGVRLIRRNRQIVTWSAGKIEKAVRCAFAELGLDSSPAIHIAAAVTTRVKEEGNACVGIEDVQDMVQEELMRQGHYPVAAHYILYRAERARHRTEMVDGETSPLPSEITIGSPGGNEPYNPVELRRRIAFARTGLDLCLPPKEIERELLRSVGTVMTRKDLDATIILNAKTLIEKDADFGKFAGRILLTFIYEEVLDWSILRDGFGKLKKAHRAGFAAYLARGVEVGRIDPALVGRYDVDAMAKALDPSADLDFDYLGVQTLYDRYLLVDKTDGEHVRLETPQFFWMRVAMGLFKEEDERVKTLNPLGFKHGTLPETRHAETYAVQLYNLYKSRRFCSSTPTLFNSGTPHSQLSSCYISVVDDNIESIFQRGIADSAYMAKFAGGLGGSWTNVRGTGSHIKGTNGESQGVIPFFKVYNDMLNAVNQCFVPGTLIHTSRGILPIEEVNALDAVLTEAGTYSMVEDAMVYKQEDPMVSLRLKHSSGPLLVTAGHPVYAIKNVTYAQNVARTLGQLKRGALTADWVEAGELRRNDCVGIAIPSGFVDVEDFTEAKCLLYGAMLGNGHICKDRNEAGINCNKETGFELLATARGILKDLQVPFWENELHGSCVQIKWTHIPDVFGFDRDDLYNAEDFKRIHPRLTHLPLNKAAWLIEGMLKTDGNVSRGKEVTFSTASSELGEGLRYQVLRLGAPTHAYTRVRDMDHTGTRRDGSTFRMEGVSYEMKVSVPMIKPLADLMGVPALTKFNWFAWQGKLFTRVKSTESSAYRGQVHDLKVDGPESYCTVDALVHNGGKRRGSGCNYLETWHNDLEDFMELRKNVGDDRRRCHEMNTAHWIPDLFMKRMEARQDWSYFRSNEVPDLHDLYGKAFEQRYAEYEVLAAAGKIWSKVVPAVEVWKLMLKSVFETGHPWLTFKDPCNVRSPQDHVGVIHSSNLCCMTADQRVVTSRGILTVGEMYAQTLANPRPSDRDYMVQGRRDIASASAMLLPRPDAPIVKIKTREGYSHKVTPDHKVWVKDVGWIEAQNLVPGDKLEIQQREGMWGGGDAKQLAFVAGLVAGDGGIGDTAYIDITEGKTMQLREMIEENVAFAMRGYGTEVFGDNAPVPSSAAPTFSDSPPSETNGVAKARLNSAALKRLLALHGMTAESKTRVPEFVWKGDRQVVGHYLAGLLVTDATIQSNEELTTIQLGSVDLVHLEEVQILLANMGVKCSIRQMRAAGKHLMPANNGSGELKEYDCQAMHRLLITSQTACRIVESYTKFGELRGHEQFLSNLVHKAGYKQKLWATFEGLEELPNEDAFCLTVANEDHDWTVNGMITKNTEITLNTSPEEIAVCNLGSVVIEEHLTDTGEIDHTKLKETVTLAVRALDNVIDINFYPVPATATSNSRHRPIGLGMMGLQNALHKKGLAFASQEAVEFNDEIAEAIAYYAYLASSQLAKEKGTYSTYEGSKWSRGILPQDTIDLLQEEREIPIDTPRGSRMDWAPVREHIAVHGMRNSNVMAIAPTATISNIMATTPCIEPNYKNLFVKSNMSGDFTVLSVTLVRELKALGLWGQEMLDQLKYYDGELADIPNIPEDVKRRHATVFGVPYEFVIDAAARRQKWIDQSQSVNLFLPEPDMKVLSRMYRYAWSCGLKTTYYLRTLGASGIEKSTIDAGKALRGLVAESAPESACSLEARMRGEVCESCQ